MNNRLQRLLTPYMNHIRGYLAEALVSKILTIQQNGKRFLIREMCVPRVGCSALASCLLTYGIIPDGCKVVEEQRPHSAIEKRVCLVCEGKAGEVLSRLVGSDMGVPHWDRGRRSISNAFKVCEDWHRRLSEHLQRDIYEEVGVKAAMSGWCVGTLWVSDIAYIVRRGEAVFVDPVSFERLVSDTCCTMSCIASSIGKSCMDYFVVTIDDEGLASGVLVEVKSTRELRDVVSLAKTAERCRVSCNAKNIDVVIVNAKLDIEIRGASLAIYASATRAAKLFSDTLEELNTGHDKHD